MLGRAAEEAMARLMSLPPPDDDCPCPCCVPCGDDETEGDEDG